MTTNMRFGPDPIQMTCPYCNSPITTLTTARASKKTHLMALLLCFLGGYCCCCLIPYCVASCKDIIHYCPRCNHYLGTYDN
ncbi:hypothetical protein GWI33_019079 [Rhynchophorus ferrugineus]|uniref:LITAF domain-containing protein n=1 Tax=Rhynchophorus ferrugineus TaxID=354439 RepID=A0A834M4J1_RHYFE|nr:hypothetical protein GWI33_019079 [Rhynchophorus ferrugineus]